MSVGPASRMRSTRPSRSASTCSAVVGLGRENRFALGAAIGTPAISTRARATRWTGTRIATFGSPAVTMSGMVGRFGRISVKRAGPKRQPEQSRARRNGGGKRRELADVCDVDDERVCRRALFGREDSGDGRFVLRVCAQSVDRLGRKRDELARPQGCGCLVDDIRIGPDTVHLQHSRNQGLGTWDLGLAHEEILSASVPSSSCTTRL